MSTEIILKNSDIYAGDLILVNKAHGLREDMLPPENRYGELVPVCASSPQIRLRRTAVTFLTELMSEIGGWEHIVPVSGWRSQREQQDIWDDTLKSDGLEFTQKFVAVPGHSEHQTGLAIDLGLRQEHIDFICPEFPYSGICQTFREKAAAYGFIQRYPEGKESVTGIGHEPWHFRYVGAPHAEIMEKNGLTLEEYIEFVKAYPFGSRPYLLKTGGKQALVSFIRAAVRTDRDSHADPKAKQTSRREPPVGAGRSPVRPAAEADGIAASIRLTGTNPHTVSGNNVDGFILTEWRVPG